MGALSQFARKILGRLFRLLVEERIIVSLCLGIGIGVVLQLTIPFPSGNPFLRYIEQERGLILNAVKLSYTAFLFTTPFLLASVITSMAYVHFYENAAEVVVGSLPPYPRVEDCVDLAIVLGEIHKRLEPEPSPTPQWLTIPERGLYTGIAVFGSIGTGKTQSLILPAMRQLFTYKADDPEKKLSGLVLEVKGDLCRQLASVMRACGRERDYVEISLDSHWRYNPLQSDLDPYALAYNIASLLTNIWGKGKEPFWQQSYTDLVKYIIILHKVHNDYVTLFDVYTTAISPPRFEQLLMAAGAQLSSMAWIAIPKDQYKNCSADLSKYDFELDASLGAFRAPLTPELERLLVEQTDVEATVYEPRCSDSAKKQLHGCPGKVG